MNNIKINMAAMISLNGVDFWAEEEANCNLQYLKAAFPFRIANDVLVSLVNECG